MIHGRDLIVALDGVAIAGAKSCKFNISQNFISTCSPTDGRVKDKHPTDYDWNVSVDCLVPSSNLSVALTDKLIAGTKCLLTFTDGSGQNRAGWVYVKSCDENGSVGSLASFSASFESTGALFKYMLFNNGTFPHDGQGFELSIFHNNIHYDYDRDRHEGPYVVEIAPSFPGKILMTTSDVWAAYLLKEDYVTEMMYNQDTQGLEGSAEKFGNSDTVIELNASMQYCTIVCNTKPHIIFLY